MWEYEARPGAKEEGWNSLEEGLQEIVSKFLSRKKVLRRYQRRFNVRLFCGHFSSSFDGGPTFSPVLLKKLGEFGVELFLDTYSSHQPPKRRPK
jgi:hypothetical protein